MKWVIVIAQKYELLGSMLTWTLVNKTSPCTIVNHLKLAQLMLQVKPKR